MNDLSSEARALLDIGRNADDPTNDDRLRVRRGIAAAIGGGVALAATTTASAARASASTTTTGAGATGTIATAGTAGVGKIAAWLGVGVVAGLVSAGTLVAVSRSQATVPRATSTVAPTVPALEPSPVPMVPAIAPPEASAAPMETPPPRTVAPPTSAPHLAPHPVTISALAAETALLEAARAALGRGDARGALTLLDEHEREFPNGTLTEERLASKVFALCDLGRRADAGATAAELLRRAPTSPLRARVLDSCAFPR